MPVASEEPIDEIVQPLNSPAPSPSRSLRARERVIGGMSSGGDKIKIKVEIGEDNLRMLKTI